MDNYFYNARLRASEPLDLPVADEADKKHKRHFRRQIRYLKTKEFRTDFTPVLPFDDPNKKPLGSDGATSSQKLLGPPHGRLPTLPPRPRKMHHAKVAPMPLTDGDTAPVERSPEEWKAITDSFSVEKHRSRREVFDNEAGKQEVHHNGRHRLRQEKASKERQAGKKRNRIKRFFSKKKLQKDMEQLAFPEVDKATSVAARSTVVAPRHLPGGGTTCQVKTISELDRILTVESSDIPVGPATASNKPSSTGDPRMPNDSPRVNVISAMISIVDATPTTTPRGRQEGGDNDRHQETPGSSAWYQAEHKSSGTLQHVRDFAERYLSHKKKPTKTKVKVFKPCEVDDKPAGKFQNLRDFADRYLSHKKKPTKTKVKVFKPCEVDDNPVGKFQSLRAFAGRVLSTKRGPTNTKVQSFSALDCDPHNIGVSGQGCSANPDNKSCM